LLTGDAAIGWELQGAKCYRTKYWDAYDLLAGELEGALERTETLKDTQFTYKENPESKRRFYDTADYNARFALVGDSGGYVCDSDGEYFILPKTINYNRPTDNYEMLCAYQQDQIKNIVGRIGVRLNELASASGAFELTDYRGAWNSSTSGTTTAPGTALFDASKAVNTGDEVQPKSRLVARYYRVGGVYMESMSASAAAAAASA
jgi:hypothetical protein